MPMVFFKMSRCTITRANSFRSCWISRAISSGLFGSGASTGLAVGPYRRLQSRTFQWLIPNSCATWADVLSLLRHWSTTERLNSSVCRDRRPGRFSWSMVSFSQTQDPVSTFLGEGLIDTDEHKFLQVILL